MSKKYFIAWLVADMYGDIGVFPAFIKLFIIRETPESNSTMLLISKYQNLAEDIDKVQ